VGKKWSRYPKVEPIGGPDSTPFVAILPVRNGCVLFLESLNLYTSPCDKSPRILYINHFAVKET